MSFLWHGIQFIAPSFLRTGSTPARSPNNRVEVLDALRGLACLIVFNEHVTGNMTANSIFGYGSEDIYVWTQLPFVRAWFMGSASVSIFFVISGYILSQRVLEQAYLQKNVDAAQRRIASMMMRRTLRLYLPTFAATYLVAFCSYLGLFNMARAHYGEDNAVYWLHEMPPPKYSSFSAQMLDAFGACFAMTKVGVWAANDPATGALYDGHLWTIPLEIQTSMFLFLVLVCLSQMRPVYGQLTLALLMAHAFFCERWEIICFLAGASMASLDTTSPTEQSRTLRRVSEAASEYAFIALLDGLYLLSAPVRECQEDPFYARLISLVPSQLYDGGTYPRAVGAALIVWATLHSPKLQSVLTNKVLLYFGDISFSFYLVHGPVIRCLFHSAIPSIYVWTGDGTYDGQDARATFITWLLGMLLCFPPTVWIADVFWRGVERPSVRLTKWIEQKIRNETKNRHE